MLAKKALLSFLALWTASLLTMVNVSSGAALAATPFLVPSTALPRVQAAEGDAKACTTEQAAMGAASTKAAASLEALDTRWQELDQSILDTIIFDVTGLQPGDDVKANALKVALLAASQLAVDMTNFIERLISLVSINVNIVPDTDTPTKVKTAFDNAKAELENHAGTANQQLGQLQTAVTAYGRCTGADEAEFNRRYDALKSLADNSKNPPALNSYVGKRFYVFASLDIPKFQVAELSFAELQAGTGGSDCAALEATTRNHLNTFTNILNGIEATHFTDRAGSSKPEKVKAAQDALTLAETQWKDVEESYAALTAEAKACVVDESLEGDIQKALDRWNDLRKAVDLEAKKWSTQVEGFVNDKIHQVKALFDFFQCKSCEQQGGGKADTQDTFELARLTCCFLLEVVGSLVTIFFQVAAFACEAVTEGDAVCEEIRKQATQRGATSTETKEPGTSDAKPDEGGASNQAGGGATTDSESETKNGATESSGGATNNGSETKSTTKNTRSGAADGPTAEIK